MLDVLLTTAVGHTNRRKSKEKRFSTNTASSRMILPTAERRQRKRTKKRKEKRNATVRGKRKVKTGKGSEGGEGGKKTASSPPDDWRRRIGSGEARKLFKR